jgi:outer membrane protein assembly factor BamB
MKPSLFSTFFLLSLSLTSARGQVFVGGFFSTIQSFHGSGGSWSNFCCTPNNPVLAFAFDGDGNLYAANGGRGSYPYFDVSKWTTSGAKDPNFHIQTTRYFQALAADEQGHLFVGDAQTGTVLVYDSSGNLLNPSLITGLAANPTKMQLDGQGYLYISMLGSCSIGKYSVSGATVNPALISVGCAGVLKFALDRKGHIFVMTHTNVAEFSAAGVLMNPSLITISAAEDMTMAADGNLLVLTGEGTVHKYSPTGVLINDSLAQPSFNSRCIAVPELRIRTKAPFGVSTNGFCFNITGSAEQVVTIEASGALATGAWIPLQTNTLGTDPLPFVDPSWTNFPQRFYRASMH